MSKAIQILFILAAAQLLTGTAHAKVYAYPAKGQSQSQTQQDESQCDQWAVKQSGVNPSQLPPPGSGTAGGQQGKQGNPVAAGAVLGATAGLITKSNHPRDRNAGMRGAARGAMIGGLISGRKRREEEKHQQQQAAQQGASYNNQMANYNNAYAACLKGRGYTVQ